MPFLYLAGQIFLRKPFEASLQWWPARVREEERSVDDEWVRELDGIQISD
jgi:hypothetical protein